MNHHRKGSRTRRGECSGTVMLALAAVAPLPLTAQGPAACPGPWAHLLAYAGTYDIPAVLGEPAVSAALDGRLGPERAHLETNLAVAGSIDLVACDLVISGNAERQGGEQMGIVTIGLATGEVSAAIRAGDSIDVFTAGTEVLGVPLAIRDWMAVMATNLRYRFELPPGARFRSSPGL